MIRYKVQPSQAKYERYPAIIIFFGKSHQNAETRKFQKNVPVPKIDAMIAEVRFVCKMFYGQISVFHVLPVTARLILWVNPCFSRFARKQ